MTLGLKDLYYAVCTEADGAESYGTPKKMAEAMSADLSVKTADGSLYADDTLSESVTEFASGTLKLGIKDLMPEVLAELLGQAVDKNSVVWAGKEDEPPYVAVGFRAKKTGGKCKDGRNHRKGSIYHCGSESRTGCKRWLGTLEEWRRLD